MFKVVQAKLSVLEALSALATVPCVRGLAWAYKEPEPCEEPLPRDLGKH